MNNVKILRAIILLLLLGDLAGAVFFLVRKRNFKHETDLLRATGEARKKNADAATILLFKSQPHDTSDVVFLGNSLTQGFQLQEMFNAPRLKNRGISSDQSGHILQRLNEVIDGHPAKIFLEVGVNDIAWGVSSDSLLRNLGTIYQRIKSGSPRTKLYINSILPLAFEKKEFLPRIIHDNVLIEAFCVQNKITYINLYPLFWSDKDKGLDESLTIDGTHLTGEGYRIWKNAVEKYVAE